MILYPVATLTQKRRLPDLRRRLIVREPQEKWVRRERLSTRMLPPQANALDVDARCGDVSLTLLSQKLHRWNRKGGLLTQDWKDCYLRRESTWM